MNGVAKCSAWIEFIPESEIAINDFPVSPGDIIYATSSVGIKDGVISGFYWRNNTNISVSASLAMPEGDTFSGQSAPRWFEPTHHESDGGQ